MIKSVLITNNLNESIELELRRPEKSGFLIQSIDGISAAKADINMTDLATTDGALFNSSRVGTRNIVFSFKFYSLDTKVSIEDLRQKSYKYFPIKKRVGIKIVEDNRSCVTFGYVESNEINIFDKEVGTIISIVCPDPYFYNAQLKTTLLGSIMPVFEFPFSNESLVDPLLEFSTILVGGLVNVQYEGEVDAGMVITIHALGAAENITIYNYITLESIIIDTSFLASWDPPGLVVGDDIIISTERGNKYVRFLRSGVYYNILNAVDKDSTWFQLKKGENIIGFTADDGINNLQITISNKTIYEGV